jgi:hypothetical protein
MTEGLKSRDRQDYKSEEGPFPFPLRPPLPAVLHVGDVWPNYPPQKAVSIHKNEEFVEEL